MLFAFDKIAKPFEDGRDDSLGARGFYTLYMLGTYAPKTMTELGELCKMKKQLFNKINIISAKLLIPYIIWVTKQSEFYSRWYFLSIRLGHFRQFMVLPFVRQLSCFVVFVHFSVLSFAFLRRFTQTMLRIYYRFITYLF